MTNQQMELGLGNNNEARFNVRRNNRANRARWWFDQMRRAVDTAFDWQPAPPARPEQIWLAGTQRQVRI